MSQLTRREFVKSAGMVAGAALLSNGIPPKEAFADGHAMFKPEDGASLRILRWKRFVQGDEDQYMANVKKFTDQTGVKVRVDNVAFPDIVPKSAVAANIGRGPDLIMGFLDDPHRYPDKLVDVSDVAEYLGKKYGGWYPICEDYGTTADGKWIGVPMGIVGTCMNYRISHMNKAGWKKFPETLEGLLELCKALKANKTPAGFAHGHGIGDGNTWAHYLLWSHGGKLVDNSGKIVVNSPETVKGLEYARELYKTFIPGTASWGDGNNNKAFLAGQVSLAANGISIYNAAKTTAPDIAEDMDHALFPAGADGVAREQMLVTQGWIYKHSKYPNAAKAFLAFMMEEEQYAPWQQNAIGYITQSLKAYESNPVWNDPKHTPFGQVVPRLKHNGHSGPLGFASASTLAEFIVVDMVGEAASGRRSIEDAIARGAKRAGRYYDV